MNKSKLINLIIWAFPEPKNISDLDLETVPDAIQLSWSGARLEINFDLEVFEIEVNSKRKTALSKRLSGLLSQSKQLDGVKYEN